MRLGRWDSRCAGMIIIGSMKFLFAVHDDDFDYTVNGGQCFYLFALSARRWRRRFRSAGPRYNCDAMVKFSRYGRQMASEPGVLELRVWHIIDPLGCTPWWLGV